MDRRTIIIGVAVLVLIIIIGYFMMKKPVDETTSINDPEITLRKSSYTINPKKVETYVIEGYTVEELSSYVDFSVNWKNKIGFEDVTHIKVERYVNNVKVEEVIKTRAIDGKEQEFYGWFQNFSKGENTCTFTNKSDGNPYSAIGTNTFKFYYKRTNDTDYSPISTTGMDLSEDLELDKIELAIDSGITETVEFLPKVVSLTQSFDFTKDPVYFTSEYGTNNDVSLNDIVNGRYNAGFDILLSSSATTTTTEAGVTTTEADADTVVLRKEGTNQFVQSDLSLGGRSTAVKLSILENGENTILGQLDDTTGELSNVIVYGAITSSKDGFKLVDFNTINDEREYMSMKFTFDTSPNKSADCILESVDESGCNIDRNSKNYNGFQHDRGKLIRKYRMRKEAFGDGSSCVTPEGIDLLGPSSTDTWLKHDTDGLIYTFNDCPVPKTWYLRNNIKAQCDGLGLGLFYNSATESSKTRTIPASYAYEFEPALHSGSDTPSPSDFDCTAANPPYNTVIIPAVETNCPKPIKNPGECVYNKYGGSNTPGERKYTYTSRNDDDCIYQNVPTGEVRLADSTCGPPCHTPDYKAYFSYCEDNLGTSFVIRDSKQADQKPGQPLCNGIPVIPFNTRIYSQAGGVKNPCEFSCEGDWDCGSGDEYWREKSKYPKEYSTKINDGLSITSTSGTHTINDSWYT